VQIAADEQRHAELGWDILGWCIGVQPRVRETVRAYQGVRLRPPASPLGPAGRRALVAERQRRAATQRLAAC
jgi:hypothetical protein